MNRSRPTALLVRSSVAICVATTLVACSSEGSEFCADYDTNGGTGATIGPLAWSGGDGLAQELIVKLHVMGDLEPPTEISDAWAASKAYYEEIQRLVEELPEGQGLGPEVYGSGTSMSTDFDVFTDWYFDTCM